MTLSPLVPDMSSVDTLAKQASTLGFEIVDISGFLELVESKAKDQRAQLKKVTTSAAEMDSANTDVLQAVGSLTQTADQTLKDMQDTANLVRSADHQSREVAEWVKAVATRTEQVAENLQDVRKTNGQIAVIGTQINTLAINAKIEAARAGDAGRGFAVVAEAINELSQKTGSAAKQINDNIADLAHWITELGLDASQIAETANEVLVRSTKTNSALRCMEEVMQSEHQQIQRISSQTDRVGQAMEELRPAIGMISQAVSETSSGIETANARVIKLINTSEAIVQGVASIGGTGADAPFIAKCRQTAQQISQMLEQALEDQNISLSELFDQTYRPDPKGTAEQMTTRALPFLERHLPDFQEPLLAFDPKVVFGACVDSKGYLPVHNAKFSHAPSNDAVWNMGHCRNKRMFNDRVGLKAGQSKAPFLLQVYRRDMGGGEFKMMKDLSAPITVHGRHWGGLRLAYSF